MALKIPVVYENGLFRPLQPVDLPEGQTGEVNIQPVEDDDEELKQILGDLVIWPDTSDDSDAWVEDLADEIAEAFRGLPPLSELIIEERNSGW